MSMPIPDANSVQMSHNVPQGALKPAARGMADEEKAVASQFEGMLVEHLLKGMRQGTFATKQDFGRQTFEQMFDEEIARAVAEQGLGLGDTLFAPNASVRPQEVDPTVDKGE